MITKVNLTGLKVGLLILNSPSLKAAETTKLKIALMSIKKDIARTSNRLIFNIQGIYMKDLRCFIENATLASPATQHVSEIYEISEEGKTYAKSRERMVVKGDDRNIVHSFHVDSKNKMTEGDAKTIINVVGSFVAYLETLTIVNKQSFLIPTFVTTYNNANSVPITDFTYNNIITINGVKYPDYISFKTKDISCAVWLSDNTFKLFYPLYDMDVVTPFPEFDKAITNSNLMVQHLNKYDQNKFSIRQDEVKNGIPSTFSPAVNIPYVPKRGLNPIPCWFGFNIYGAAGNYEYLMREALYDYLKKLGLTDEFIEEHFPSIFEVNEFFMVPEWTDYALPSKVGQGSINSQINLAYTAPFKMNKFVPAYSNSDTFMKQNTYNVPLSFNNIMCRVLNGKYTEFDKRDFKKYYSDLITVPTTSSDFGRMSMRTQHFAVMISYMVDIADASTQTEVFNKLMAKNYMVNNKIVKFTLAVRRGVTYISTLYDEHRYYMVPRYEFERIN